MFATVDVTAVAGVQGLAVGVDAADVAHTAAAAGSNAKLDWRPY